MFQWLKKNAADFGFHRPYTSEASRDNKGYAEEKWHWSYVPLANQMKKDWETHISQDLSKLNDFILKDRIKQRAPEYVSSVSKPSFYAIRWSLKDKKDM